MIRIVIKEDRGRYSRRARVRRKKNKNIATSIIPAKPSSKYNQIVQKLKEPLSRLPGGAKLYLALTGAQAVEKGYEALRTKAESLGYSGDFEGVLAAFSGDLDDYPPNHAFAMIGAFFDWAKTEGIVSLIPGVDEIKFLAKILDAQNKPSVGSKIYKTPWQMRSRNR